MEKEKRPLIGFVNTKAKLPAKTQRQGLIDKGCLPEKLVEDFNQVIDAARGHFPIAVWRVDCLGDALIKGGPRPRDTFKRRVKAIRAAGLTVFEASQDRWCHHGDNFTDMMFDAWEKFSQGGSKKGEAGRPEKAMTPDQIERAKLIWRSNEYVTNAEAFAVLQRLGWTKWLMQKYELGKSGREAGRPREKK